ncbi:hypothetical protein ACET3X_007254 [Alternaria dauci]|uniref:Kinetochore protein n=1 Tax=Alternaria dauci TaxID=48095 RepID=A0ABR3UBG0_9PLEO
MEHRKIELQSPADLAYLTNQIRTAARQKLDLHLPPVPPTDQTANTPDELRRSVEDLVDTFIAQVLHGMRHNISINGLDVVQSASEDVVGNGDGMDIDGRGEDVETIEYEAFDDKLRTQLSATVAKRDALIAKISQQRRTTPKVAAEEWIKRFEAESAVLQSAGQGGDVDAESDGVAGVEALQRQDEVERNWEKAVLALQRLNKGLPETRARLERAGDVVGYLGGGKK